MKRASDRWARLSGEWARSGRTQGEFCAERGLDVRQFRWWRWRLGLTGSGAARSSTDDFVPVRLVEGDVVVAGGQGQIEVRCNRGLVVRLVGAVDVDLAARLILRLEAGQ